MQKCEIMLNDLIDSKRTNTNIKATIKNQPQPGNAYLLYLCFLIPEFCFVPAFIYCYSHTVSEEQNEIPLDKLNTTIVSSNFWPPIQVSIICLGTTFL